MSMILNSMVSICKNGGGQIHPCLCRTLSTNANKGCALKRCLSNSSFRLVSNVNKNISFKQKAVGFTSMSDRVTLHPFAPFWRSNQLCRTEQTFLEHCRHFRTTKVNHMIPIGPAIWAVVKPLAKVASIVAGRYLRKTYRGLSPEKKLKFRKRYLKYLGYLMILLCVAFTANYYYHIVETPITHRKRYIAFTDDQIMKVVTEEANEILEKVKPSILAPEQNAASYNQVTRVVQRIVNSNQDLDFIKKQTWTIVVVQSKEANAFVLPTGHIFVFTGLLQFVDSEDKLAVVLGHEMAHALLQHGCEKLGMAQLVDYLIIFLMAAIWAVMPSDGIALVTQWFYHKVVQLLLHLPFNRKLEKEADIVGLELIAKACYDVREAPNFWNLMYIKSELQRLDKESEKLPEWISTHPASENRAVTLETLLPKAMETRMSCRCSQLSKEDPRCETKTLMDLLEKVKLKQQEQEQEQE